MTSWQPIETAPEGELFLGQCADEMTMGTWTREPVPAVYIFEKRNGGFIGGPYGNSVMRLRGWAPIPTTASKA